MFETLLDLRLQLLPMAGLVIGSSPQSPDYTINSTLATEKVLNFNAKSAILLTKEAWQLHVQGE